MKGNLITLAILLTLTIFGGSVLASPSADLIAGSFTNASFQGRYAITADIGPNTGATLGVCDMDGYGNFACEIMINVPSEDGARILLPVSSTGTYRVNADGTGTVHEVDVLPDGSTNEVDHSFVIIQAETIGPYLIATEISGFSNQPGDPSGSLLTQVLTRLPDVATSPAVVQADNSALTQELHQHFSENDLTSALAMAGDDVEVVAYAFGLSLKGQEQFMGFMQSFKTAFPDITITPTNVVSNGDQVVVEFKATGTHTGPLVTPAGEIPATGNSVSLDVVEVQTWQNGKLVKLVNYQDAASLMRQIGVLE